MGLISSVKSIFLDLDSDIKRICLFSLTSIVALLPVMFFFRGSFYMLYVHHAGPIVAICLAQLFALGVLSIVKFINSVFKFSERVNIVPALISLTSILVLVHASSASFSTYSPIAGNLFRHLETGIYKDIPMGSTPLDISLYIFSATGINPAYVDKPEYFLCIDNWRMRRQRGGVSCASLMNNFHKDIKIVHSGPEWAIYNFHDHG